MALLRWEPALELSSLQGEMNRLFKSFLGASGSGGGDGGTIRRWVPGMDVVETEDTFVLRADLPGMSEQDVKIELEDNILTVSGERKSEHEQSNQGYYRVERAVGQFARTLTLPEGVDPESVTANFDKGVLEVRIPKPEERKPRRVSIGVGKQQGAIEGRESGNGSSATNGAPAENAEAVGKAS